MSIGPTKDLFLQSYIFEILFFQDGQVNLVEESQAKPKLKKCSEANLFLVPFDHYNLSDTMQLSMLKKLDDDIPPVFMILDTFEKEVRSILPGKGCSKTTWIRFLSIFNPGTV